jgi:protocatechuate 3,4-dioxygenase alpha subunit
MATTMTDQPAARRHGLTPSQTVGPFLSIALTWDDGPDVVPPGASGAIEIVGHLYDGNGDAVPDGLVETWQADTGGRFAHGDDPRGTANPIPDGFRGFGRSATDATGRWQIRTVKPGSLPTADGAVEAPHLDVSVLARGLLDRVVTRIYFPDETIANEADPVLSAIEPARRTTLVAVPAGDMLQFDIHLQGPDETVFFDL